MALTVDVRDCRDWEDLEDALFDMGMVAMAVGVGHWTADRLPEVYARAMELGLWLDAAKARESIARFEGMRCNVTYEPQARWTARVFKSRVEQRKREWKATVPA